MAKELPYFKFEPNAWDNGNIQMCSKELKGLFIDLCSIYWSRLGELPYALALQKHCNGDSIALQSLIDLDILGLIDGQIIIDFLDEQLNEFQQTSDKRRAAANKRWSDNASAMQVHSKSNAIREEKRREEEIKEDNIPTRFSFRKSLCELGGDVKLVDEWLKVRKAKKAVNTETAYNKFINQVDKSNKQLNDILKICVEKSWSGFEAIYLDNLNKEQPKRTKAPSYGY